MVFVSLMCTPHSFIHNVIFQNESKLLGVAGTDVTVQQIQDLIPYNRVGLGLF